MSTELRHAAVGVDPTPEAVAPAAVGPTIRLGATTYPLLLPNIRDSRLHVAAVVLSIHALGQLTLGFRLSVPQILAAILSCAVVEVVAQFAMRRVVAWPASAMLTGSGVALILRDVGTDAGDHWTFRHWWLFALVATGSLATKYTIRWNGTHVFNPSNVGLVVAFLVLGSDRIEPLDFWWAPMGPGMILAYGVLLVGGTAIVWRGRMAEMSGVFWVTLAVLLAALSASGHCIAASWSPSPVCDTRFWWTVMTSPETLIFLFFMITDPRTVPVDRRNRIHFGAAVAVASTLFIAPQQTEFGAKVGLLGGLVVLCALRPVAAAVLARGSGDHPAVGRSRPVQLAVAALGTVAVVASVALVGAPARSPQTIQADSVALHPNEIVPDIDPARVPTVTIGEHVQEWFGTDLSGSTAGTELVRILDVEALGLQDRDPTLLKSVDHGRRLDELWARIDSSGDGPLAGARFEFETMHLEMIQARGQGDLSLGIEATGTRFATSFDGDGSEHLGTAEPFELTFALRPGDPDRWFLVDIISYEP